MAKKPSFQGWTVTRSGAVQDSQENLKAILPADMAKAAWTRGGKVPGNPEVKTFRGIPKKGGN